MAGIQVEEAAGEAGRRAGAGKAGGALPGRAGAVIAVALQHRVRPRVAQENRRIALAVGEIAAHRHAVVLDLAVGIDVARHLELVRIGCGACPYHTGQPIALLMVVEAVADVELHALEPVVHDEVHDA